MRDTFHNISPAVLIPAATYSADNTPVGVDLTGFNSALILLNIGVGGITFTSGNKIEFVLSHSDNGTDYTPVTDDGVVMDVPVSGNGIIFALMSEHATPSVRKIGYVGGRKFIKLLSDFSGTHGAGTPMSAAVARGHAYERPVA